MLKGMLSGVFGTRHDREKKRVQPIVDMINVDVGKIGMVTNFSGRYDAGTIANHDSETSPRKEAPSVRFVAKIPREPEHMHIVIRADP